MNPTFKQVTKTRYVQLVAELAQEIFVQHYTKLTPKVAAALADKYQSDILTDDDWSSHGKGHRAGGGDSLQDSDGGRGALQDSSHHTACHQTGKQGITGGQQGGKIGCL